VICAAMIGELAMNVPLCTQTNIPGRIRLTALSLDGLNL
jgi:hypothetical protein